LIQGSVQPPPIGLTKADWQEAMCDVGFEKWQVNWSAFEPARPLNRRAEELARWKYSLAEHSQRR